MSYRFYDGHIYNRKDIWTDQFIEEHKDEIDWAKLLKKVMLTEEQIEKYKDYIIWKNVFLYQPVSEQFIEKYIDKLETFDWVCAHRNLSIEFTKKYEDKIHWNFITQNTLSDEFLREFSCKINWQTYTILHCYDWNESFMREFAEDIDWQMLLDRKEISNDLKRELAFSLRKNRTYILRYIGCTMVDKDWKEWSKNIDNKKGQLEDVLHYNRKLSEELIMANSFLFNINYIKLRWNRTNKFEKFLTSHPELFNSSYD